MEKALVNTSGFGTTAVAATENTKLVSINHVDMYIAFNDSYKTVPIDGPTINNSLLNIFKINGENFNEATDMGLQGSVNPKDADGGTPSSTLAPPVSGCVYQFRSYANGYLYIFAKLHSDIAYTVFEDVTARDYLYVQGTDSLNNVLSYTLKGNSEGYLTDAVLTPQEYDARYGTAYNTASMGVVKVKVHAGGMYKFNANGSTAAVLGFGFDTDGTATIDITDGGTTSINLLTEGSVPTPEIQPIGVPELAPLIDGNCVTRSIYVFNDDNTDIQTDVASVKTDVASVKTSISNLPISAGTGLKST